MYLPEELHVKRSNNDLNDCYCGEARKEKKWFLIFMNTAC